MTEKTQKILRGLLGGFVLVTIGFALGKEVTLQRLQSEPMHAEQGRSDRVAVYYTHASVSCVTCRTMERLIRQTLSDQFAEALAGQTLTFQKVDFQQDKAFARRYQVVANAVVVSLIREGQECGSQRLDDIWNLYQDPVAFKQYVGNAIQSYVQRLAEPTS